MRETPGPLPIAKGKKVIALLPGMANRHGLIAGATGTGKTVTLRVLAERFSAIGVPVFLADVKGDLSGIPRPGGDNPKVVERVAKLGLAPFAFEGCPSPSGTSSASRGTPCGRQSRRWAPSCWADPEPQRHPGRRARPDLPDRRRQRPPAAGPQRPARDGAVRRGQRRAVPDGVRKRHRRERRFDPARPADPRGAGRGPLLRGAGPRPAGSPPDRSLRQGEDQHPGRLPADEVPHALRHVPALSPVGALRAAP